jgi:hypothetical protein
MIFGRQRLLIWVIVLVLGLGAFPPIFGSDTETGSDAKFETRFLPLPVLFYRPQTSIAFGAQVKTIFRLGKNKHLTRPSSITPEIIYTLKKQIIAKLLSDIYLAENQWHISSKIDFRRFPDLFYGTGNDTSLDDEEDYTSRAWDIYLCGEHHLGASILLGGHFHFYDWTLTDTLSGGMLENGTIPGSEGGTASGLGFQLKFDTRDRIFYPHRGELFTIAFTSYHPTLGSTTQFSSLVIDLRKYLPLTPKQVVALQMRMETQSGEVPFPLMSQLGGPDHLRGYYSGRFRDNNLFMIQAEWRYAPIWRLGISVFAGLGQVTDSLTEFGLRNFNYSLGFGLRYLYNKRESMYARMDFGWGSGSSGIYMEGDEAY